MPWELLNLAHTLNRPWAMKLARTMCMAHINVTSVTSILMIAHKVDDGQLRHVVYVMLNSAIFKVSFEVKFLRGVITKQLSPIL